MSAPRPARDPATIRARRRRLLLALPVAVALTVVVFWWLSKPTVTVVNRSGGRLDAVTVTLGGQTYEGGALEAGRSREFVLDTPSAGQALTVTMSAAGGRLSRWNGFPPGGTTWQGHKVRLTVTPVGVEETRG